MRSAADLPNVFEDLPFERHLGRHIRYGVQPRQLPHLKLAGHPALQTQVMGLRFRNPVGIAAGLDRGGDYLHLWDRLGFGFIELGSTSWHRSRRPTPTLRRLSGTYNLAHKGGLGSPGIHHVARNLANKPAGLVVGVNIGKRARTPVLEAGNDLLACFEVVADVADYIALNTRWPLTPGEAHPQPPAHLERLLAPVANANAKRTHPLPVLVKTSPDLAAPHLAALAEVVRAMGLQGVILGNTVRDHAALAAANGQQPPEELADFGIGGRWLRAYTAPLLPTMRTALEGGSVLVASGGAQTPADVAHYLQHADLVQLYSGWVYHGPALLQAILQGLVAGRG